MNKVIKISLFVIIIIIVVLVSLSLWNFFISNNKIFRELEITKVKSQYYIDEDVIISGVSLKGKDVTFFWDENMAQVISDKNGKWIANFGKMKEGSYNIEIISEDFSGGKISKTVPILINYNE